MTGDEIAITKEAAIQASVEHAWENGRKEALAEVRDLIEEEIDDFEDAIFHAPKEDFVELKAGRRALQDLLKQISEEDSVKNSGE